MTSEIIVKIDQLLRKGLDSKLSRGGSTAAIESIEEAYRIASDEPSLSLWKKICAYRLAHLYFRKLSREPALHRIEELLKEASEGDDLGPWPGIYLLAVLHLLRPTHIQNQKEIENIFARICSLIQNPGLENDLPNMRKRRPLQVEAFNLLELMAYIMKLPYELLDGSAGSLRNGIYQDLFPGIPKWQVLRNDWNEQVKFRYTEDMARKEIKSILKAHPDAYAYEISCTRNINADDNYKTEIEFKAPGSSWERNEKNKFFEMLTLILIRKDQDKIIELLQYDANSFRQAKRRFLEDFKTIFRAGISWERGRIPFVPKNPMIVGMVDEGLFRRM